MHFYPLKQRVLLIPALRELDVDLNVLFLYSEEGRSEQEGQLTAGPELSLNQTVKKKN